MELVEMRSGPVGYWKLRSEWRVRTTACRALIAEEDGQLQRDLEE